jgi:hypothetical protein
LGTATRLSPVSDMVERGGHTQIPMTQSEADTQEERSSHAPLLDAPSDTCHRQASSRVMHEHAPIPDTDLPGSFVPARSTEAPHLRLRTRLQDCIRKEKKFTDETIRYGFITTTDESREPRDLVAAIEDKNWKVAMDDEIQALDRNKTWHLVQPNKITNVIDCK